MSYLGNVVDEKNLSVYQSNNLIIDLNILELKDTYKNSISQKIYK